MPVVEIDKEAWSGDGDFTKRVLEALATVAEVAFLRVEDAPASRSEAGYNFLSNEIYVKFAERAVVTRARLLGILPVTRRTRVPALTLGALEQRLTAMPGIGEPDYSDDGMLQYLRAERIVPRYQTRGFKLVELLRIYEVGTARRGDDPRTGD